MIHCERIKRGQRQIRSRGGRRGSGRKYKWSPFRKRDNLFGPIRGSVSVNIGGGSGSSTTFVDDLLWAGFKMIFIFARVRVAIAIYCGIAKTTVVVRGRTCCWVDGREGDGRYSFIHVGSLGETSTGDRKERMRMRMIM